MLSISFLRISLFKMILFLETVVELQTRRHLDRNINDFENERCVNERDG